MSLYGIHKFLYQLENDEAFLNLAREDPERALAGLSLSDPERTILGNCEVGTLYRMGVHAFLLNGLARHGVCGVNRENYMPRLRAALER